MEACGSQLPMAFSSMLPLQVHLLHVGRTEEAMGELRVKTGMLLKWPSSQSSHRLPWVPMGHSRQTTSRLSSW